MATQILAVGTSATSSADVAVTDPLTVCLKDAEGNKVDSAARVLIELKDDAGQYFVIDELTSGDPARVIVGPGTYRFTRPGNVSVGVFSG